MASIVVSRGSVVAADDGRCSEVGAWVLKMGGNAVDAAIAAALCLGVLSPTSSGIGGGGFMLVRDSKSQQTVAINMREKAPSAASRDMYANDPKAKSAGPRSLGVPGELAGLFAAWEKYGTLPWRLLLKPAIKLAKEGFEISAFTGYFLEKSKENVMKDPGLREIFTRDGRLLKAGDRCVNPELGRTLEAIATLKPEKALYDGPIGEKLADEVQRGGGILTMEDLRNYRAEVMEPISTKAFGYEILGVPPPSSGGLAVGLALNVMDGYDEDDLRGSLGLHRLAEALKHVSAKRMKLGDPNFDDVVETVNDMLSSSFAASIRGKIDDDATFSATHYGARSSQVADHGTSHLIVVDKDGMVVSMTTSLNDRFGGGMRSISTGIILNNVMADFSTPTGETQDDLPPAWTNFIEPNKRPLSSMAPFIILKDNRFAGAIGGGGGLNIIPAVIQIFINHFVLGMETSEAVRAPRIYHSQDSEILSYESWTVFNGEHFELSDEVKQFLISRGHHKLAANEGGAICQLVVQSLDDDSAGPGILTAVCDPRKGGRPAGVSIDSIVSIVSWRRRFFSTVSWLRQFFSTNRLRTVEPFPPSLRDFRSI